MQALAAGGLAEALQADIGQMLPHVLGGFDDIGKFDIRRRIEIEHQPARDIGRIRRAIPGMQFEAADLRHRRETLDAIDLQIRLAIAGDFHQLQQLRGARHRMALEEFLAADAIGRADDGAGPALQMADHPAADRLEITREIELGHALAVAAVRPQLLVGL